MTIKEFIIELLDKLGWPITVIVLVLLLWKQISGLIGKIHSLKYKDLSVEFDQKLKRLEESADSTNLPRLTDDTIKSNYSYYVELVEKCPSAAILESWVQLEEAIQNAIGLPPNVVFGIRNDSISHSALADIGLNEEQISYINELRKMRNKLIHGESLNLSAKATSAYALLALRMIAEISKKRKSN